MTYPFIQFPVELIEGIFQCGVHAVPGLVTEIVNFIFVGEYAALFAITGHVGFFKFKEFFQKGS